MNPLFLPYFSYIVETGIYKIEDLHHCMICPRECGTDRFKGLTGYCRSNSGYNVASICIHRGEEPAISGPRGICNVFFSKCNLQCMYCQNYQISRRNAEIHSQNNSLENVVNEIKAILDQGIQAVGFVTPSHFTPHVRAVINELNRQGYHPVTVYNTNGYDKVDVLKSFEGLINVYLPDFKYLNPELSERFSDAPDYPDIIKRSLTEMYRQKGSTVIMDDEGQALSGLIIRHLVLPGCTEDSMEILKWIAGELSPSVYISLMAQYYPTVCVSDHPLLNRRLTSGEYDSVVETLNMLGFYNGWVQELESANTYKPDFKQRHPFE